MKHLLLLGIATIGFASPQTNLQRGTLASCKRAVTGEVVRIERNGSQVQFRVEGHSLLSKLNPKIKTLEVIYNESSCVTSGIDKRVIQCSGDQKELPYFTFKDSSELEVALESQFDVVSLSTELVNEERTTVYSVTKNQTYMNRLILAAAGHAWEESVHFSTNQNECQFR